MKVETYGGNHKKHQNVPLTDWITNGHYRKSPFVYSNVMAGGKTFSITSEDGMIHTICNFYSDGIEFGIIDVPRIENKLDECLLDGLYQLPLILGRRVEVVYDIEKLKSQLKLKKKHKTDTLIILLSTTSYLTKKYLPKNKFTIGKQFNKKIKKKDVIRRYDEIINILEQYNISDKTFLIQDEFHKGMSEGDHTYKKNMGSYPYKLSYTRYKMGKLFRENNSLVLGMTATPLTTMIESWNKNNKINVNSSQFYIVEKIHKSERVVRTSVIDSFNLFDYDRKKSITTEYDENVMVLQNYITMVNNKEKTIEYIVKKYDLEIPQIKTTGLIKIYGNLNGRINRTEIQNMFNSVDINEDFEWCIATSDYGVEVFEYNSLTKSSHRVDSNFENISEVYSELDDYNSRLKFMCVIEMGSLGVNIKNLYGLLSFREPTTYDEEKNPVINNIVQVCGRPIRLKIRYEDIDQHTHLSSDDKDKIWAEINSVIYFLPDDEYYQQVITELESDYFDKYSVVKQLKLLRNS